MVEGTMGQAGQGSPIKIWQLPNRLAWVIFLAILGDFLTPVSLGVEDFYITLEEIPIVDHLIWTPVFEANSTVGTPSYLSPEICKNNPYGVKAGLIHLFGGVEPLNSVKVLIFRSQRKS